MRNDPGPTDGRSWGLALGCAALGGLGLFAHARSFYPFFADDSFISLQYSRRLLDGAGLTFADGEWVEGYSNLLWVLLVAAGGALGMDLVDAARMFGFLGMFAAIAVLAVRFWDENGVSTAAIAGFLACSGSMAVWAIGGLEQGLLAGLLAVAFASSWSLLRPSPSALDIGVPGAALALVCITRPDGPLFAVALAGGLMWARRDRASLGIVGRLAVLPAVFVVLQLGFRLWYYGEILPNTANVKLGLGIGGGLQWMAGGALGHLALVVAAGLGLAAWTDDGARRRLQLVLPALVCWTIYVIAIGGDIFPARRHLVPLIVLLAFPVGEGFRWLAQRSRLSAWGGCLALVMAHGWMQDGDAENRRAVRERWEWDCASIGNLLSQSFGADEPLLAAGAAGCMPYFSGLNTIDLWGLNDRYLATHPLPGKKGRLGHHMGDLTYVLDREPDLLQFGGAGGDRSLKSAMGRQFALDPRFKKHYRPVTFQGRDPLRFQAHLWVRLDGLVGVQRTPGRIEVPAFLLGNRGHTVARLDRDGRLGIEVTPRRPAQLLGLQVPVPEQWQVEVQGTGGDVEARLGGDGVLGLRATSGAAFVHRVVLTRN